MRYPEWSDFFRGAGEREIRAEPGTRRAVTGSRYRAASNGIAMEAFAMYVARMFEAGARLVHLEVLAFNRPVLRMLARIGVAEQARLRDQVYAAGRFWDVLVFAFDADQYRQIWTRYARMLPGGDRGPAAIGARRKP